MAFTLISEFRYFSGCNYLREKSHLNSHWFALVVATRAERHFSRFQLDHNERVPHKDTSTKEGRKGVCPTCCCRIVKRKAWFFRGFNRYKNAHLRRKNTIPLRHFRVFSSLCLRCAHKEERGVYAPQSRTDSKDSITRNWSHRWGKTQFVTSFVQ